MYPVTSGAHPCGTERTLSVSQGLTPHDAHDIHHDERKRNKSSKVAARWLVGERQPTVNGNQKPHGLCVKRIDARAQTARLGAQGCAGAQGEHKKSGNDHNAFVDGAERSPEHTCSFFFVQK